MVSQRKTPGMNTRKHCRYTKSTLKRVKVRLHSKKALNIHDIHYKEPTKKDMAVGLVYFNSSGSKRLLMNYLYTVEKMKLAKIPYYTIEMYTDKPDIADAIHVKTDFILFQKERLCYVLEKHIPKTFKKLLFMDTDLIFDNENWYNEASNKLDAFELIQCFSNVYNLDITYKIKTGSFLSYKMHKAFPNVEKTSPGGAWAFQRDWYNKVGFFQHDPMGGSDVMSLKAWTGGEYRPEKEIPRHLSRVYEEFTKKITELPSICYIEGGIYHLWHGTSKNRQYGVRSKIFRNVNDIMDIMKVNDDDIFELTDASYRKRIMDYFLKKDDDGFE